ncbi:MAG: flagellar motor switch protein FliN [Planctomycetes bacterium]|nr:flagellar motor switch protein FliN [Planctomycetota bacterium]
MSTETQQAVAATAAGESEKPPAAGVQESAPAEASTAPPEAGGGAETILPPNFPEFPQNAAAEMIDQAKHLELLRDVSLKVKVELGRGKLYLKDILRLARGSVVELEKLAGDPLDIFVNDRLIARGEVLVLNDNFCVRITEILSPEECMRLKIL